MQSSSSSIKRKQPEGGGVDRKGGNKKKPVVAGGGKEPAGEEEEEASGSSSSSSDDEEEGSSDSSSGESESEEEQEETSGGKSGRSSAAGGKSRNKGGSSSGLSGVGNEGNPDMEKLYVDEKDRERLNQMSEFDREKVLHQRYVDRLRKQQREELFHRSEAGRQKMEKEQQKKQAVFLDIRAKRNRQRLKQGEEDEEEDSDASGSGKREGNRRAGRAAGQTGKDGSGSSGSSSSSSSGDDSDSDEESGDEQQGGGGATTTTTTERSSSAAAAAGTPGVAATASLLASAVGGGGMASAAAAVTRGSRMSGSVREEAGRELSDGLFADGEVDEDGQRNQRKRRKLLEGIDLPLLQSVLLNVGRMLHMLEHPKAESYLSGCFVLYRVTDGVAICSIVGVRACEQPYTVEGKLCKHELILRPGTMHSLDTKAKLTQLDNAPVTLNTLEKWRHSLSREKSSVPIDDWQRKMKSKAQQLKAFTYTEDDVQRILEKNTLGGISRGGSIVKQKQIILHEIQALKQNTTHRIANRPKVEELEVRYKALEAMEAQKNQQQHQSGCSAVAMKWPLTQLSPVPGGGHRGGGLEGSVNRRGMMLLTEGGRLGWGGLGPDGMMHDRSGGVGKDSNSKQTSTTNTTISAGNPFARRECRPTMMWDIQDKKQQPALTTTTTAGGGDQSSLVNLDDAAKVGKNKSEDTCEGGVDLDSDDELFRERVALSESHEKQQHYLKTMVQLYREMDLVKKLQIHVPGVVISSNNNMSVIEGPTRAALR
eukprot:GHVS01056802.1.p1 GENE.GHVS01056802.1~~GHVS01056802.1.p1  ORF type:complete len:765 (+),score=216.14 GHVS01056802.1:133-2427(+)